MRHILVACSDPAVVDALRDAADPSTVFLPEPGLDEALERLSRSARIDAVVTDDPSLVAAIREEIPGSLPVHLLAAGDAPEATLAALDRIVDGE